MKTLITSHINADCDAFSAMLGAGLLYPDSDLLFPGTQENSLAQLYKSVTDEYGFVKATEIDWKEYDRLVLVDTRQKNRLPHIAGLLSKPNLQIDIWDHHPASPNDLEGQFNRISSAGSTTSIICEELQKRNITVTPAQATLLGLGIYGDTGSFTFSSTTRTDFLAAAWLVSQGMDVTRVNDMACHELTGAHIHVLNSLLETSQTYIINNIPIVIAEAAPETYLENFAVLAQKLMEIEKYTALFVLGLMGDRIQIVGRSLTDKVNVAKVCAKLGGGGHAYAASACVRDKAMNEVREKILNLLADQLNPQKTARDYMSAPAIGISSDAPLKDADALMLHFGLKAIPVFIPATKICAGLITAQTAARATAHGLGDEPLGEYMQRRVFTLPPDAHMTDIADIIINQRQRLVPVVENDNVIGVVTRTDLINLLANQSVPLLHRKDAKTRNVAKLIAMLPKHTQNILKLAGKLGKQLGLPVYAVGGFARDLLLNYPNHDIDLVAEGNGIILARALAQELGGRVREHDKFLTSVVIYHDDEGMERHIDVATARLEYYEYPAALPTVELSSIKMDLFRRDFSINAVAIRLDSEPYGELIDFFGGQRDIKDKLIRALHTLSFVEDPTRCIRAVRFEQRYKFKIGIGTEKLIKNILPLHLLEKLSPTRLFNEFRLICEEENAAECLMRLNDLGVLHALGEKLTLNPLKVNLLKSMKKMINWYKMLFYEKAAQGWICYFLALSHNLNYAEASENYDRLGLPAVKKFQIMQEREKVRSLRKKLGDWQKRYGMGNAKVSHLYELLKPVTPEFLLYIMAGNNNKELEKNISLFITQWSKEKPNINGNDLKKLGIPPGPIYSALLKEALYAKLDDRAPNAKMQLGIVIKYLKKNVATDKKHL